MSDTRTIGEVCLSVSKEARAMYADKRVSYQFDTDVEFLAHLVYSMSALLTDEHRGLEELREAMS